VSVERTTHIDVVIKSVGQFDRTETWKGKVEVTLENGLVRLGSPTQAGFESITFTLADLHKGIETDG
jgi:hypothetical protein